MKIQKSSLPYIFLLLGLLIGIPTVDYIMEQDNNTNQITIEVVEQKDFLVINP